MSTTDPLSELSRLAGSSVGGLGGTDSLPRAAGESVRGADGATGTPSIPEQRDNPFVRDLPTLRPTSTTTTAPSVDESRFRTPEERIDDHLQRLVTDIMRKQEKETQTTVDNLYEKRVRQIHDARMKQYLEELHGNRTLGGSADVPIASLSLNVASSTPELDPATVAPYLQVVYKWNRNPQAPLDQVFHAFQNAATTTADSFAWRFLQSIIAHQETGALSFYCHQFQQIVKTRVREASNTGQDMSMPYSFTSDMAKVVASYVRLTTNIVSSQWPIVYYCLRCGGTLAALNVLESTTNQVEPSVHRIISSMSHAQGPLTCLWDAPAPPVIAASDRQAVAGVYDRVKHQGSADPFHLASLALLSVKDLDTILSSPVIKTTEDYMFGGLWYALQQPYPREAIIELGNNIQELGQSNFSTESAWGYALPLMAVQRYRAALTHVAKTNLLQATHAAMVLYAGGMDVNDVGTNESSSSLLTTLLLDYAAKLKEKDSLAALEYVARIPDEKKAESETGRLVVESQQLGELQPRIQELFRDNASSVLVEAAEQARTRGNADMSAHLYFKASRYDLLLSLLNHQLASEMSDGVENTEWHKRALQFHAEYLAPGRDSQVMQVLEKTHAEDRLETFQILMDLYGAFESARMQDFERAWSSMERLPLLPANEAECAAKAEQYSSLDPAIKEVFPTMLEKAMESLSQMYARLRSSSGQSSSQEQDRLRSRASLLLFNFAGILQREIPADVFARMTTFQKAMI